MYLDNKKTPNTQIKEATEEYNAHQLVGNVGKEYPKYALVLWRETSVF